MFSPRWNAEDRVRAYGIWRGVPCCLAMLDDSRPLAQNILETTLVPGAALQNEADRLIRMESRLRDVALYGSILRTISAEQMAGPDLITVVTPADLYR